MFQASSVAIIAVALPRRFLGKAIGIQGACQALGLPLGPAVGGLLLAGGGWRLVFLVNVAFAILGTVAAAMSATAAGLRAGGRAGEISVSGSTPGTRRTPTAPA